MFYNDIKFKKLLEYIDENECQRKVSYEYLFKLWYRNVFTYITELTANLKNGNHTLGGSSLYG